MQQYDIEIEKYWVTQSGHFILETVVLLGMGITYENLLLRYGISDLSRDNKI